MKKTNVKSQNWHLWLTILVLLYEFSIFFYGDLRRPSWAFLTLLLTIIFLRKRKKIINQKIILLLISVYVLILLQYLIYAGISIAAIYKPLMLFFTPFLFVLIQKEYFAKNLFQGIYILSIISTLIYLVHTFIPPLSNIIDKLFYVFAPFSGNKEPTSLIIYSIPAYPQFSSHDIMRNSGFTHEPGAFALIILLGIVCNTIISKDAFNKRNLILAIILLTTFSTAGYIALFIFFGYFLIRSNVNLILKLVIFPVFIFISLSVYDKSEFLSNKIETSLESDIQAINNEQTMQRGRFFGFIKAAEVFTQNPITGQGILTATETQIVDEEASFGYGFMGLLARYGILFGGFYLYFFYKGFLNIFFEAGLRSGDALISFIILNLSLLTQPFFLGIPFVGFFFIGYLKQVQIIK